MKKSRRCWGKQLIARILVCCVMLGLLPVVQPSSNVKASTNSSITLNYSKKTLKSGQTLKLKVKKRTYKKPENVEQYWYSSNPEVATIDESGIVTAKLEGTTEITYTENEYLVSDDFGFGYYYRPLGTVTCTITVKRGKYKVSKRQVELIEGQSAKIKASKASSYRIDYGSTEGHYGWADVTEEKNGTFQITAKSYGKVNVIVEFYSKKGTYLGSDQTEVNILRLGIGEESITRALKHPYQLTVNGYEQKQIISWTSSDPTVAKVSSKGKVTPLKVGDATITLAVQAREPQIIEPRKEEEEDEEDDYYDDWDDYYEEEDEEEEEQEEQEVDDGIEYYTCEVHVSNPKLKVKSQNLAIECSDTIPIEGLSIYSNIESSSSKPDIVSVDTNYLWAQQKGSATITLKVDGVKLYYKVYVTNPTIKEALLPLEKGKMKKLHLEGTNKKSVPKFKSMNRKIALVSQKGTVKGVRGGSTSITVEVDKKEFNIPVVISNQRVVKALDFGTKAIGSPYSQEKRMSEGYFDCSSLAWRAYHAGGVNFGASGWAPTAADLAKYCVEHKKAISYEALDAKDLKPGDLLFFAKGNNGRYKNIYHVAMYAGVREYTSWDGSTYQTGLLLEARDNGVGLFEYYPDARNVVVVARPTMKK